MLSMQTPSLHARDARATNDANVMQDRIAGSIIAECVGILPDLDVQSASKTYVACQVKMELIPVLCEVPDNLGARTAMYLRSGCV